MSNIITINKPFLQGLLAATKQARRDGIDILEYQSHKFVLAYAEYLLEAHCANFGIPGVTARGLRGEVSA